MIMWRSKLDPYIKVLPTTSSSFLPILLSVPGLAPSAHIAVYLPTSGKEAEFVSALANLEVCLDHISQEYSCPVYLRGDFNVNPNNVTRAALFQHFCTKHKIHNHVLDHPTHHHFLGDGLYDAQLDLLLSCGPNCQTEICTEIICKLENPLVQSHHDLIFSTLPVPIVDVLKTDKSSVAPKIPNDRVKIIWEEENIPHFQELLSDNLSLLRKHWNDASSPTSISILLSSTNDALASAAKASNKFVKLGKHVVQRPVIHPDVKTAQKVALHAEDHLQKISTAPYPDPCILEAARISALFAKSSLRKVSRSIHLEANSAKYSELFSILQKNPSNLHKSIRNNKSASSSKIQTLKVGEKFFSGSSVPDGFFESLSNLKAPDMSPIKSSPSYQSTLLDYEHIMEICRD